MTNVHAEIKNDKLVITCDISKEVLEKAAISKSGKSHIVASTNGFTGYGPVKMSLNVLR